MFESRRKANAIRKTHRIIAMIFAIVALSLFFLGMATTFLLYYIAFISGIVALVFIIGGGGTWSLGAEGEETVATHLSLLGDPYRVIHDVVLPSMTGNIDHIVLGPNGVFVIETKNNNGFISCNGDSWTQRKVGQRGTPYLGKIGCPSKQAKRYAIFLRSFIQDKLDRIIFVNCAVVFTNHRATVRVYNPTVPVLRPNELCRLIKLHQSDTILNEEELQKLEKAIRSYSRYN